MIGNDRTRLIAIEAQELVDDSVESVRKEGVQREFSTSSGNAADNSRVWYVEGLADQEELMSDHVMELDQKGTLQ
jgi:hypothetical protein